MIQDSRFKRAFLRLFAFFAATFLILPVLPAYAAGSITPSGGGKYTNGSTFTITVRASGATFDSLQGIISVTGPVSIVSFAAGGATWLPGKAPANNSQFVGITSATSSLTVATIRLKGTKEGSGKVTVSGVRLAKSGAEVGTSGGSTSFTITRAPTPPGGVTVSSPTHPNPEESYEATAAQFVWEAPPNGATGYSFLLDQEPETVPPEAVTSGETTATYEDLTVGTYYFHIRAANSDGWSAPTHFKINIKPSVDSSLATPVILEITADEDRANSIEQGTLSGISIKGTGPAGFAINLNFQPSLALPAETDPPDKYAAPTVSADGQWGFKITDPIKAGFYKLVAQAQKEGTVSPESSPTYFEVSVAEGGKVRIITASDETQAYKQAEAARVAAAAAKKRTALAASAAVALIVLLGLGYLILRKLRQRKNLLQPQ